MKADYLNLPPVLATSSSIIPMALREMAPSGIKKNRAEKMKEESHKHFWSRPKNFPKEKTSFAEKGGRPLIRWPKAEPPC